MASEAYRASCWRTAQCRCPAGGGKCARCTDAAYCPDGSTPTRRPRSTLADALGSRAAGERRTFSEKNRARGRDIFGEGKILRKRCFLRKVHKILGPRCFRPWQKDVAVSNIGHAFVIRSNARRTLETSAIVFSHGVHHPDQIFVRDNAIFYSHSLEWSISNFPCSLTRNITSHSMKNLAFHSLLRCKMTMCYKFTLPHSYIAQK